MSGDNAVVSVGGGEVKEAEQVPKAPRSTSAVNVSRAQQAMNYRSMVGTHLPPGRLLFRPQLFWVVILPEHVATPGLDFRLGAGEKHDINYGRVPSANKGPFSEDIVYRAMTCVDHGRENDAAVSEALRTAASWGKTSLVQHLLCSCYCTSRSTGPAVCESSMLGHVAILRTLLRAGGTPNAALSGKTALELALNNGNEEAARVLIAFGADTEVPLQRALDNDQAPLVRRLKAFAASEEQRKQVMGEKDDVPLEWCLLSEDVPGPSQVPEISYQGLDGDKQ